MSHLQKLSPAGSHEFRTKQHRKGHPVFHIACPLSKSAGHQGLDWQRRGAAARFQPTRSLLTMLELDEWCGTATMPRNSGQSLVCVKGREGHSCRSGIWKKLAQNGHMRISIPTIPYAAKPTAPNVTVPEAIKRLTSFLRRGTTTVLTGAGVSVDSGIKAYRGQDGRYMNPNFQPIFYHELIDETEKGHRFRQRYWLRSYLGYPPVRDALPNITHVSLAALQHASALIPNIITQNVDGLHHKALKQVAPHEWNPARAQDVILELHGTLHRVSCNRGHKVDRGPFQDFLSAANPQWHEYAQELVRSGTQPRTNPDGDVAIEHLGISYRDFSVPNCPTCLLENRRNPIHKPEVIFFGESIPKNVKERSFLAVEKCDQLLLIGTTLATYSAFRLVKHALELKKPIMLLNVGPTRVDGIPEIQKLNIASGVVLREVAAEVISEKAAHENVLFKMLQSGIVKPPPDNESAPRAAG